LNHLLNLLQNNWRTQDNSPYLSSRDHVVKFLRIVGIEIFSIMATAYGLPN